MRRRIWSGALEQEARATLRACALVWLAMAGAMLVSALADLWVGDHDWRVFTVASVLVAALSTMIALAARGSAPKMTHRFGFLLVVGIWVTSPMVAALPLALYGLSPTDAVFETVSGFSTTGATVMSGLDNTPHGVLLWRSMLQWMGGVGILALGVVILPFLRIGGMQIFSKESSDQSQRPLPRFDTFARALLLVYGGLTLLCLLAYHAAGMPLWQALNHAMTTLSTGGFSTSDASFGQFDNAALYWVATVFMLLGGMPFGLLIALLLRRHAGAMDPQVGAVLAIAAVALVALSLWRVDGLESHALAESAFNIVSVLTTTGYAVSDYTLWGPFAVGVFYCLTFLGAAAGSTSGGLKAYRLIVLLTMLQGHLRRLVNPHELAVTRYGGAHADSEAFRAVMVFVVAFGLTLLLGTLALTACGLDIMTAHTGALTALTNVGPGLGPIIGPAGNFGGLPDPAKWVLILGMLMGRLEIFPLLVVLSPAFWRR